MSHAPKTNEPIRGATSDVDVEAALFPAIVCVSRAPSQNPRRSQRCRVPDEHESAFGVAVKRLDFQEQNKLQIDGRIGRIVGAGFRLPGEFILNYLVVYSVISPGHFHASRLGM